MHDVAQRAGVSIATVSFVVNDSKPVAPATRARVETAMKDLGYHRNSVGRALARGRTYIIALLYPALQHSFSRTAVRFFTSAAAQARARGYNLVLWPISNEAEQVTELTSTGLVDGVLLMEVQLDDSRVGELERGTTPFALIGRTQDTSGIAFVDIDFESTIESAIDHLMKLGHTNLALVDGGYGSDALSGYGPVARSRSTFGDVTTQRGLSGVMLTCDENPDAGRELAASFSETHPDTTAVLVMNELAAPGFVAGMKHSGTRIPDDVSIISVGSSADMASMADPQLTLMTSPSVELGSSGVDAVIDRIENPENPLPQSLIPCTFTAGRSVARVRSSS
ncbi:LacI family DNA-binding transcriptional regulator [Paramicrobacterium fandaimingii]|uniref:LacI family DNA-binding transcriptional regulator n=1 Tax=Paramicrobacterium fandaimingii TaxID=2708079 RepID=UPI001F394AC6|nr:LacI family DNA-binding transcriptional regulator [Microbacterium fandaimingii]